jgi:hypothetical protein
MVFTLLCSRSGIVNFFSLKIITLSRNPYFVQRSNQLRSNWLSVCHTHYEDEGS